MSQKCRLFLWNLNKLERIIIIFGTHYAQFSTSPNSCDLTLPGNTLTTEYARCVLSWMRKNYRFQKFLETSEDIANSNTYSEILSTTFVQFNKYNFLINPLLSDIFTNLTVT